MCDEIREGGEIIDGISDREKQNKAYTQCDDSSGSNGVSFHYRETTCLWVHIHRDNFPSFFDITKTKVQGIYVGKTGGRYKTNK